MADPTQVAEPVGFILAVGTDQHRAQLPDNRVELTAGQALVGQDDHGPQRGSSSSSR
jgi:hypothetical protein